jgi:hypothetical protein
VLVIKKCAHNEERIFGSNACGMASGAFTNTMNERGIGTYAE